MQKHKPCQWPWDLSSGQHCLFLQELIHGPFDMRSASAVMQERPPVCVTDCKSLYDHLSAVCSPSSLQDKHLIIRESLKKTSCVIRWAPTGLQLTDGLRRVSPSMFEVWVVHGPM